MTSKWLFITDSPAQLTIPILLKTLLRLPLSPEFKVTNSEGQLAYMLQIISKFSYILSSKKYQND